MEIEVIETIVWFNLRWLVKYAICLNRIKFIQITFFMLVIPHWLIFFIIHGEYT